jgi:protocatechuate 3,4-dioxygenase beta subunit
MTQLSTRRRFIRQASFGVALFTTPGLFAEMLSLTPRQTEGPFYPDKFPLDTDNDLLILNDKLTPAVGEVTHLTGRILSASGEPIRNAVIEIWQADANGAYLHSGTSNADRRDGNFQGFGRFLTGSTGDYYFRTIKPVPYPGRSPHIHMAVYQGGKRMLTTQCYIDGDPLNDRDGIYQSLGDAKPLVSAKFEPLAGSTTGELQAKFDLVIGKTPEDADERGGPGGTGGPRGRGPGRRPNGPPPEGAPPRERPTEDR